MATTLLHVVAAAAGAASIDIDPAVAQAAAASELPLSAPSAVEGPGCPTRWQLRLWRYWAAGLPAGVPLPWVHCDDVEGALRDLGDEGMALEAAAVQALMDGSWPRARYPRRRLPFSQRPMAFLAVGAAPHACHLREGTAADSSRSPLECPAF